MVIERQVIATWYTPDEKLPKEDYSTVVTFSGKSKNITWENALGIATWIDDGLGWIIEGLPEDAEFEIIAWCDLDPYGI